MRAKCRKLKKSPSSKFFSSVLTSTKKKSPATIGLNLKFDFYHVVENGIKWLKNAKKSGFLCISQLYIAMGSFCSGLNLYVTLLFDE